MCKPIGLYVASQPTSAALPCDAAPFCILNILLIQNVGIGIWSSSFHINDTHCVSAMCTNGCRMCFVEYYVCLCLWKYTTVSVVRLGCCDVSLYVYVVNGCGKRDCLIFPMQLKRLNFQNIRDCSTKQYIRKVAVLWHFTGSTSLNERSKAEGTSDFGTHAFRMFNRRKWSLSTN